VKDSPNLDLLRAMAVGLVVVTHVLVPMDFDLRIVGRVGVSVFFVHTCLVLMASLERRPEAVPFFVRRFFRIYPLVVAVVVLISLGRAAGGLPNSPRMLLSNLFLVQNITGERSVLDPFWTLPYEVQMYLLLPLLYRLARVRGTMLVLGLWAGCVATLLGIAALGVSTELVQWAPCFLAGVLAFTLAKRPILHPAILVGTVAVGAILAQVLWEPDGPLHWIFCLALGTVIPYTRPIDAQGLLARSAKLVATYSYSIYITHVLAIQAGFDLFPALPVAVKLLACAVIMAAFARVCYRWIEAPGIALGARIAQRLRPAPVTI
jgi:peptidoglycan/LPS O-acetylase OafA/YrhL